MDFVTDEYLMRLKMTKQKMQERGIEILLVSNPSNMNYFVGYNAWSFYVPQVLMIDMEDDIPYWIGREMDANSARETTWLDDQHILSYTDDYVHSLIQHPMDFVSDFIKQHKGENKCIGLEMETHFFTAKSYEHLLLNLPNAKLIDASVIVNWLRLIKSEQEIEYLRRAARIAERAMQTAYDTIDVGVRECEAAAAISHIQYEGTAEFSGDYPAIVPMLPRGKKTSSPHMTWSADKYEYGDPVIIELAGAHRRYHAPLARTMVLGKADKKLRKLTEVIIEGLNKTIEAIKPGASCEEVEEVWRESIHNHGYHKDSRIGYSVGVSYPPDWGEHTVSFRKGDKTIIQKDMVFHIIPGIWFQDYGAEISETVLVTQDGCHKLTQFPQDLYIKK